MLKFKLRLISPELAKKLQERFEIEPCFNWRTAEFNIGYYQFNGNKYCLAYQIKTARWFQGGQVNGSIIHHSS